MELTVVHNPTAYDIPIATMSMPKITSDMMVQISDFSGLIRENIDALRKPLFVSSSAFDQWVTVPHANTMLTTAFAYDSVQKRSTPLWYQHSLSGIVRTESYIDRTISIVWPNGETVKPIQIPESITGTTIIAERHMSAVDATTGSIIGDETHGVGLAEPLLVVDYARGIIHVAKNPGATITIQITYRIVTIDIAFSLPTGYTSRLSAICRPQQPAYYAVSVLTDYPYPVTVMYDRCDIEHAIRHSEYTQVKEYWYQGIVPSGSDARSYTIAANGLVTIGNGYRKYLTYAFISRSSDAALIKIRMAPGRTYDECWHLQIKGVPKRQSVKRQGVVIDRTHIKVPDTNLYITRSSRGSISNITALRDNGEAIRIADCDAASGIVETAEPVSKKETIYVTYDFITEYDNLPYICMNPCHIHDYPGLCDTQGNTWATIRDKLATKACILSMYTENGVTRIGVTITSRVESGTVKQWTYKDLKEKRFNPINGSAIPFSVYTYNNGTFEKKTSSETVIPLAVLYLSSPVDESAVTIEDARTYGGGTLVKLPDQYDTTFYDGEITDMSSRLNITIKKSVYDELVGRIIQHDADVQLADNKDEEAAIKARGVITKAVDKAALSGSIKEITIE